MTTDDLLLPVVISVLLFTTTAGAATTKPSPSPQSPPPPPPPPPPLQHRKAARPPPPSHPPPPPPPAAAAAGAAAPAPANCSDELVSFSKCLPYTSSSPNNSTNSPSRQCCNDVASAFASGGAVCLCYLIQKPSLLGFPLNSTRLLSLTSLCPIRDHGTKANFSLTSLCSRTHTLPPLKGITITSPRRSPPQISGPLNPSPVNHPPPPTVNFTQGSQESTPYSDSPPPADSDTPVPSDSDTPAPPNGLHAVPRLPLIPSWRQFSTSGINSKSGWLLPFIMAIVDVIIPVLT